jgi:O-antigen/teichoic acid export membrane protein
MASGLISFPILTRTLGVDEYGIMGLVVMLLAFVTSLAKLGLQHASVRLWPEWERRQGGPASFVVTLFLTGLLISLPATLVYNVLVWLLRPWIGARLAFFIALSSPLVLIQSLNSFGVNVLRARQWSRARALFDVGTSYSGMILAVLGAAVLIGGLRGYYVGLMSGQGLALLVLLGYVFRRSAARSGSWSAPLARTALAFGFPMALFELCSSLWHLGDRFLIQWFLDERAVGFYTMAYNLSMYVNALFTVPMDMAAVPMYTRIYETAGPAAASDLLRKSARFFFLLAIPAVAGMMVVREDVVLLLASRQFLPGAELVPLILAGLLVYGSRVLLGAGMFLRKRPWLIAGLEVGGAAFNTALNLLLLPALGVRGAALATLISQLVMAVLFWRLGSQLVMAPLELGALVRLLLCGGIMALCIGRLAPAPVLLRLPLRIFTGAGIYVALVALVDPRTRIALLGARRRARRR